MIHAIYNGKDPRYKGEGALLQTVSKNRVKAQFDNMEKLFKEAHSWTEFNRSDWCISI